MVEREHILKTLPDYWDAIASGEKTFEVRRDDRGFQRGDVLVLQKLRKTDSGVSFAYVETKNGKPTEIRKRVLWVLTGGQFGVEPGHVVMSLGDL